MVVYGKICNITQHGKIDKILSIQACILYVFQYTYTLYNGQDLHHILYLSFGILIEFIYNFEVCLHNIIVIQAIARVQY